MMMMNPSGKNHPLTSLFIIRQLTIEGRIMCNLCPLSAVVGSGTGHYGIAV